MERFSKHLPRYTEASLVKKLEELGIGRPSTYAPTISTIQKREYVVKADREGIDREYKILKLKDEHVSSGVNNEKTGAEKAKLFPEDIGLVVNDFLVEHFDSILDYNFTANVEKEFDRIAAGETEWNLMIKQFYKPFHSSVENTLETSEKATGERVLGEDSESGKPVIVRLGRYGPMVQIGYPDDEEKPRFASLLKNQSIESITFEEALDLFKLPRTIGVYEDDEITAAIGKFGPYVRHKNKFYSLRGDDDPMTVELDRSIELIEEKRKADREKIIKVFEDNKEVQVLAGRYGPYISIGRNNYRIPKNQEPSALSLEQCLEIAKNAPKKKGKGFKSRKK
jgi:DNA topoisomerase-1